VTITPCFSSDDDDAYAADSGYERKFLAPQEILIHFTKVWAISSNTMSKYGADVRSLCWLWARIWILERTGDKL
jgi:hypothetical protein